MGQAEAQRASHVLSARISGTANIRAVRERKKSWWPVQTSSEKRQVMLNPTRQPPPKTRLRLDSPDFSFQAAGVRIGGHAPTAAYESLHTQLWAAGFPSFNPEGSRAPSFFFVAYFACFVEENEKAMYRDRARVAAELIRNKSFEEDW